MTPLQERSETALLVIDVQNDVVVNAYDRGAVVKTIGSMVTQARDGDVPVIWVQHDDEGLPKGSDGWQIVDELEPLDDEPLVHKHFRDSFDATTLDAVLAELDVRRLVVCGAQTDFCVRWTLHSAHGRGYDTVLVADGHTTDDPSTTELPSAAQTIALLNNVWASQATTDRLASVATANEIDF